MKKRCDTAAVLGAGVMGSSIAAHLAGAGIPTYLWDRLPPDLTPADQNNRAARNRLAQEGLQKALQAKPAAFYDPDAARLITPGNLEDDLDKVRLCDLVIEAVVERLDVKRALLARLAPLLGPDTLVASNTSGLSIAKMAEGFPEALQRNFVVMHFFNPVRYMQLLEIVPGPLTSSETVARAVQWGQDLGKGIVYGRDTPNFVANRIGIYSLMKSLTLMQDMDLTIEEVDKIAAQPMGRPSSGVFRTCDVVGIDTMVHVAQNCYDSLIKDQERGIFKIPDWLHKLVSSGYTGQKAGCGFYKKEGKDILVLNKDTFTYRPSQKVQFESLKAVKDIEDSGARLKALIQADDKAAVFAWKSLSASLAYSARCVGEITDDIVNIDRAMRWGFNWDLGPFEAWDAIGVPETVQRMHQDGLQVPAWIDDMLQKGHTSFYQGPQTNRRYYHVQHKSLSHLRQDPQHIHLKALHETPSKVIQENMGASLLDLGDGCLCLEIHTKLNTLDNDVISMLDVAIQTAERDFEALVIGNNGKHFSAGANLMLMYMAAQQKAWDEISDLICTLQNNLQRIRYAKIPVVAAPFQYTLGGGAEVAMAADACQAHAETYMGLVEVGVGLIPAGGGCLRMLQRWSEPVAGLEGTDLLPLVGQAALHITTAQVSTSAQEAKKLRYLQPSDGISWHRDSLLQHAKQRALGMARSGYRPMRPPLLPAAGWDAAQTLGMRVWSMVKAGFASAYDAVIAHKVLHILCGGQVAAGTLLPEQHYLDLEREAFLSLCGQEKTQARMQSMLLTNKPLRN